MYNHMITDLVLVLAVVRSNILGEIILQPQFSVFIGPVISHRVCARIVIFC